MNPARKIRGTVAQEARLDVETLFDAAPQVTQQSAA
jgi:hypothetical protein